MWKLLRVRNLLALAVILFAMGMAYSAMHTTQGVMGVAVGERPLAAEQFRAPIAHLEAHLFAAGPLSMEQRVALATAFDDMRKALEARTSANLAKYSARELKTLAGLSRGLGDLEGADLDRVRQNWMRVRANTFDDASWFRFSEADPAAPPEEPRVPLSDADRVTLARLKTTLEGIEFAIGRGEREVERLGEPQPSGTVDDAVASGWRDWVVNWRDEMDRLRRSLPSTPDAEASQRVRFAWDSVGRAVDELSAVPAGAAHGGRPPYRVEWTRHFQNARREVQSAKAWIEKAEQGRPV